MEGRENGRSRPFGRFAPVGIHTVRIEVRTDRITWKIVKTASE